MSEIEKKESLLDGGLLEALRRRPATPELPQFDPAWLTQEPVRPLVAVHGGIWGYPAGRLRLAAAAAILTAFALGAFFGTVVLAPSAEGYSEVVRLRSGVRLRAKVVNLVGSQVVVETPDSVYVIESDQVKSLNYGRSKQTTNAYRRNFPDREVIELSNGMVLRGRIINQLGNELLIEAAGESFTLNRSEIRKIKYLAEAPR